MHALNKCNPNKPQFKMQDIMNYDWELKFKKKKKKKLTAVILVTYWGFDMRFRMHEHVVWSYLYVSGAVDRRGYGYSWKFAKKQQKVGDDWWVPQKDFIISNMVTHKLRRAWQLVHVMWVYSSCFQGRTYMGPKGPGHP